MPRRPAYTVFLLRPEQIARADFGPLPDLAPMGVWQKAVVGADERRDDAAKVAAALELGPRCGRQVWVLTEEAWTQNVSLSTASTAGLDAEELRQALTFDVEPLSGIAAADSVLGFVAGDTDGDQQDFWVTQMSAGPVSAVQRRLKQAGGHLAGVSHPGGLPELLRHRDAPPGRWRRVEVWQRATLCVQGGHGSSVAGSIRIINATSDQPSWERWIQRWLSGTDATDSSEWLGGGSERDRVIGEVAPGWEAVDLSKPADLGPFMTAWAAHVLPGVVGVPWFGPPPLLRGPARYFLAAALVELLVLVACGSHYWANARAANGLTASTTIVQSESKALAALKKDADAVKADIDATEARAAAAERAATPDADLAFDREQLGKQRVRVSRVMSALASSRPSGLVVQQIDRAASGALTVRGFSAHAEGADALAAHLADGLAGAGWVVGAPSKRGQLVLADAGPWAFAVTLTPAPPPAPPPKPAVVGGALGRGKRGGR